MNAYEKLKLDRTEKYIVANHNILTAASRDPEETVKGTVLSLQQNTHPQPSQYFDREGNLVPLWVAITHMTGSRILFYYATEMELHNDVYVPKAPKVGNGIRQPHDIFLGDGAGQVNLECFVHINTFFTALTIRTGPVFFEIVSETPASGKGKHKWIDAFCVDAKSAIDHARKQFHAGQGRNTDGVK